MAESSTSTSEMITGRHKVRGFERGLEPDRITHVQLQYTGEVWIYIKWKGSDEIDPLPAPEVNERFPQLVIQHYQNQMPFHAIHFNTKKSPNGFQLGLEPEKVTAAGTHVYSGQLWMLMTWKGSSESHFVLLSEANERCPQLVIQYYESQLRFPVFPYRDVLRLHKNPRKGFERGLRAQKITRMGYNDEPELQFWIKWAGYPEIDKVSSSEAMEKCPEVVIEYYLSVLRLTGPELPISRDVLSGFRRGLEAEKILGVWNSEKKLAYMIKWKNSTEESLVHAGEAVRQCPQMVVQYLDNIIKTRYPLPDALKKKYNKY